MEHIERAASGSDDISLLVAQIDPAIAPLAADDVDTFLNWVLRRNDLIIRLGPHRWLLAISVGDGEMPTFFARVEENRQETNRNRPRGPLPPIELCIDSAWPRDGQAEEILNRVRHGLEHQETLYVCT